MSGLQGSTGEGITESFYGFRLVNRQVEQEEGEGRVKSQPKDSKPTKERAIVRHNIHFSMDEGEVMVKNANAPGSILTETIRSAWSGGALGQQNASHDKVRRVPAGTYALGFVANFQPSVFKTIFEQASNGFPARFSYAAAGNLIDLDEDGELPDVEHPGMLSDAFGVLSELWSEPRNISYAEEVRREIRMEIYKASRLTLSDAIPRSKLHKEELELEDLDAHRTYHWAKLSALLVLLEGRTHVEVEDFALAKEMYEVQKIVRGVVLRTVQATQKIENRAADSRREQVISNANINAGKTLAELEKRRKYIEAVLDKVVDGLRDGKTVNWITKNKLSDAQKRSLKSAIDLGVEREILRIDAKTAKPVLA